MKTDLSHADTDLSFDAFTSSSNRRRTAPEAPPQIDDEYLRGAARTVQLSAIGGSIIVLLFAIQSAFNTASDNQPVPAGAYTAAGLWLLVGLVNLLTGLHGGHSLKINYVIFYSIFNVLLATWQILLLLWHITFLFAVVLPQTNQSLLIRTFGYAKTYLILFTVVDSLLAACACLFYALAAYASHRLAKALKAKQLHTIRNTQRQLAQEAAFRSSNSFHRPPNERPTPNDTLV